MNNEPSQPGHKGEPTDLPGSSKSAAAPGSAQGAEDASAQALSEALRSSFTIVKLLMGALVMAFILSGVFTVKPNQVAIKLRLGRVLGVGDGQLLKPGLHWKLPYPVDEIVYVPVGESHTVTSTAGWYSQTPEEAAEGRKPQPLGMLRSGVDGYTLAGDGDIIHARATLTYRIGDPINYVFNFANPTNLLQHILDNALFYVSARFSADDALYRNKLAFQEAVQARVEKLVEQLKLGVRGATNKAVGDASVIFRGGLTASNNLVTAVAAEADRFAKLLPSYQANPELFKRRFLAERIGQALTNAQYKVFLPERADGKPWELRLQLSKEPEIRKKESSKAE